MGLAASQARLLNLTSRMHDIEYKAQKLEAQKLQMANESTQVYQEYENALNKTKVQFKQIGTDGAANYVDASIATLLANGYQIEVLSGGKYHQLITGASDQTALESGTFKNSAIRWTTGTKTVTLNNALTSDVKAGEKFYADSNESSGNFVLAEDAKSGQKTIVVTAESYNYETLDPADWNGAEFGETFVHEGSTYIFLIANDPTVCDAYKVSDDIVNLAKLDLHDEETLSNLIEAGLINLKKPMSDGTYEEVNIATDTSLQEVSDETLLKKAEAKYEADMRKINLKDKKFDTELASMDAERNAIKTEMDTLKSVAKENVDRTFKLFG